MNNLNIKSKLLIMWSWWTARTCWCRPES